MIKKLIFMFPLVLLGCASQPPLGTPGSGVGSDFTPVIDGPLDDAYYKNLHECRQIAYRVQRQGESQASNQAFQGALIGGALGALIGDDHESTLAGAAIGGLGSAGGQYDKAEQNAQTVISNCMRGRGYNVLL